MERKGKVFFSLFTYFLYSLIIIFTTSLFLFANFINNTLGNFILALPLSCLLTAYIFYLLFIFNVKLRSIWSLAVFFVCYIISTLLIFLSSFVSYRIWFFIQIILMIVFSFIWLIAKLIYLIRNSDNNNVYLSNFFLPFSLMCIFTGILFYQNINQPNNLDQYRLRGLTIFNKIADEIEKELEIENNSLYRIKYIAFNEEQNTLDIGCLANIGHYYHLYSYNYNGYASAEQIFTSIESESLFPEYNKTLYLLDEDNSFVINLPLDIKNNCSEISYVNYIKNDTHMCDAIVKQNNIFITFSVDIEKSQNAKIYTYEELGNNVLINLQKA